MRIDAAMPQGHSHGATELKLLLLNEGHSHETTELKTARVFPRNNTAMAAVAE